jgi:type IV secretion system protein VirD4
MKAQRGDSPDVLLWAALAGALVVAVVWVSAGVASLIGSGGWHPGALAEIVVVVLRLPSHLGEPRLAWAQPERRELPGVATFYLSAAIVLGTGAAIVVVGARVGRVAGLLESLSGNRRQPNTARWARRRDLRKLIVSGPVRGRMILGRFGKELVAAEPRQSVIVFGPTGTFKTAGLAIPVLREWEGPVIATSVKTDQILNTIAQRRERGRVFIFDPAQATGLPSTRISPLVGCEDWGRAGRAARWVVDGERVSSGGLENSDFWFSSARRQLHPMFFAAARGGLSIADVLRWLEEGEEADREIRPLLAEAGEPAAVRAWEVIWRREERQRSSIQTTAEVALQVYGDSAIAEETGAADFDPAQLVDGGSDTLFLYAPEGEQERLAPVFSTVIQMVRSAGQAIAATQGQVDPALLVQLDEAGNVAAVPRLDSWAATGGGQGMQINAIFQDFAQVRRVYGQGADTVVNNFGAKLFLQALGDPSTLDYIASITGVAEYRQHSHTAGEGGQRSTTEGSIYQPMAPPNEIREAAEETGLLVYRDLPPARITLRDYRKQRTGKVSKGKHVSSLRSREAKDRDDG